MMNTIAKFQKRFGSEKGFTLVEVLIAMAILSVGMLAISAMQINSTAYNQQAMEYTRMSTIAADQMEDIVQVAWETSDDMKKTGYYDPLLDEKGIDSPHTAPAITEDKYRYDISWTVEEQEIGGGAVNTQFKVVTVTVMMSQLPTGRDKKTFSVQNIIPRIIG